MLTGILDDSFALCMARHMSLTSLLTFMGAYRAELEHTVLSNLMKVMFTILFNFTSIMLLVLILALAFLQITDKVGRIVADAKPELMNDIKQFFIGLFLYSAE